MNKQDLVNNLCNGLENTLDTSEMSSDDQMDIIRDTMMKALDIQERSLMKRLQVISGQEARLFDHYAGISFEERLKNNLPNQKQKTHELAKKSFDDADQMLQSRRKWLVEKADSFKKDSDFNREELIELAKAVKEPLQIEDDGPDPDLGQVPGDEFEK